MEFNILILLALVPVAYCDCSDYKNCLSCSSTALAFETCKWCEMSKSCHHVDSSYQTCKECTDSLISKVCFVRTSSKCDRTGVNGALSGQFEPYEAFNATLYSAIAYSDEPVDCAKKILGAGHVQIVEIVGKKCEFLFKYKECFAITAISHSLKKIILAYRGTTSQLQLIDEFATVLGKFKVSASIGGSIQAYFSNANDQLYPCVKSSLKDLVKRYPSYGVIISGHSLGGAIASIASAQLVYDNIVDSKQTVLYTFGMPRPGDRTYAFNHDKYVTTSWRIVHYRDIVSKLPPMTPLAHSPYHHQREIFYGEQMGLLSNYIECFDYEDSRCNKGHAPSQSSVNYHKMYYGIDVGSHCDINMGKRRKRADADSDMSHLLSNVTCKRIRVDGGVSSASIHVAMHSSITFLILSAQVMSNFYRY